MGSDEESIMIEGREQASRRSQLISLLPEGAWVVLKATTKKRRSNDTYYPYRQDSNFVYVTGYQEEPSQDGEEAIVVIAESGSWLFRIKPNAHHIRWEGPQPNNQEIKHMGQFTDVLPLDQFARFLTARKAQINQVYGDTQQQAWYKEWLGKPCADAHPTLSQMRMVKSPAELALMQQACDITVHAHRETIKASTQLAHEQTIAAFFQWQCAQKRTMNVAYNSIVAAGKNACVLHYTSLQDKAQPGSCILMDAGAEVANYAADITRVWPYSGTFTSEQRTLYEGVLSVQERCLARLQPGSTLQALQAVCEQASCEVLLDLGLVHGTLEEVLAEGRHKRYFCHAVGHSIGLDVHDPMAKDTVLAENMVVTVEPGLYIPAEDDTVPEGFRGVGIRIEDMAVLTESGNRVMSADLEKSAAAIEQLCRG